MKKCPYCAEEIQEEAIKCKFCGEFLDGNDMPSPQSPPQQQDLVQRGTTTKKGKKITGRQVLGMTSIIFFLSVSIGLFRLFTFVNILGIIVCFFYIFHRSFQNRVISFLKMDASMPRRGRALGLAGFLFFCLLLSIGAWGNSKAEEEQQRKREEAEIASNRNRLEQVDDALSRNDFNKAEEIVSTVTAHPGTSKLKADKIRFIAKRFVDFYMKKSTDLFGQKKWAEAADSFEIIESKMGSNAQAPDHVTDYLYKIAGHLLDEGEYQRALALFKKHPNYKEAQKYITKTTGILNTNIYKEAKAKYEEGLYEEAENLFKSLGEYEDAPEQSGKCRDNLNEEAYKQAAKLFNSKNYQDAKAKFSALSGYKKSLEYLQTIEKKLKDEAYSEAQSLYKKKKYTEAKAILAGLSGYKNSIDLIDKIDKKLEKIAQAERMRELEERVEDLSYKELKKNPARYAGRFVKFKGKVFSIQENLGKTVIQVNVTSKGYGFWTDQIIVSFNGETDIVEDNIIVFYGTVLGAQSYTSVAGWDISVPAVSAEFLRY